MARELRLEAKVRRWLSQQVKDAKARLPEAAEEIEMLELRLDVEADVLAEDERSAMETQIEDLRLERATAETLVKTLPERIKLYRPLGRPEPTVIVSRN